MHRTYLSFLGSPRLTVDGHGVECRSGKAVALLAYLAVTGRPHTHQELVRLLWSREENPHDTLFEHLHSLSTMVDPALLRDSGDSVFFAGGAACQVDVALFRHSLKEYRENGQPAVEALKHAVRLYTGEFLDGLVVEHAPAFDSWRAQEAEGLRTDALWAFKELALLETQHRGYEEAINHTRAALRLDPYDESSHRQLMTLLFNAGQRGAAMEQYRICLDLLDTHFGRSPENETLELYEQIKKSRSRTGRGRRNGRNHETSETVFAAPDDLLTEAGVEQERERLYSVMNKNPERGDVHAAAAEVHIASVLLGLRRPRLAMPQAGQAAQHALHLDPEQPAAHVMAGNMGYLFDWDMESAEREFLTALRLAPKDARAHIWYSAYLSSLGRHTQAVTHATEAHSLLPESALCTANLAIRHFYAGAPGQALETCAAAPESTRKTWVIRLIEGWASERKGALGDAIRAFRDAVSAGGGLEPRIFLAHALARSGKEEESRAILTELSAVDEDRFVSPFLLSGVYLALDRMAHALELISRACEQRDVFLALSVPHPLWDEVRYHPDFRAVVETIGIDAFALDSTAGL